MLRTDINAVVVAGMHRSGTSLLCQHLATCGLQFGSNLHPPSEANRKGYFEDMELTRAHDTWLGDAGLNWRNSARLRHFESTDFFDTEVAGKLINRLSENAKSPIGLKDPRITFFLENWTKIISSWAVIVAIRPPNEVVDSLLRRGDMVRYCNGSRLKATALSYSLWLTYNTKCMEFYRDNTSKCVICQPAEILDLKQTNELCKLPPLRSFNLNSAVGAVYDSGLMIKTTSSLTKLLGAWQRRSNRLYAEMKSVAYPLKKLHSHAGPKE